MALRYPRCPECGERATHRPCSVVGVTYVEHSHTGCDVYRYAVEFDDAGQQVSHKLPPGVRFEEWLLGDAA